MNTQTEKIALHHALNESMSYEEYMTFFNALVAEGKTTGPNQSEAMVSYTKMNAQRMKRLNKTVKLLPELAALARKLDQKMTWLALTEPWCGDAAQNLPLIHFLAEALPQTELRLSLRDEHLELMDQHLTDGGRGIPKVLMLDENLEVLAEWGPRPVPMQEMIRAWKNDPNPIAYGELAENLHKAYAQDKTQTQQAELLEVLKKIV